MPDPTTERRPAVLLLAGDVRDEWTRTLGAGGVDVATTGWLDGITAARLRRPDLLLVSTDLPEGAVQSVLNAFRLPADMRQLPIVVAGAGAGQLERLATPIILADHYVPDPGDGDAFAGRIRDAIRGGRVPLLWQPAEKVASWLLAAAFAVVALRLGLQGVYYVRARGLPIPSAVQWSFLAAFLVPVIAAVAIGVAARTRPFSIAATRTALNLSLPIFLLNAARLVPAEGPAARLVGYSLGCAGYAAWAWLGPKAKPRSRGVARAFRGLAVGLLLLAGGFVALAAWASSRG
jgi:hypothetical protein